MTATDTDTDTATAGTDTGTDTGTATGADAGTGTGTAAVDALGTSAPDTTVPPEGPVPATEPDPAADPGPATGSATATRRPRSRTASVLGAVLHALRRTLARGGAVLALLAVWEAAPRLHLVDRTFLPPFSEVLAAWWGLLADGQLLDNTEASLGRAVTGFVLAVVIAVPLGLLIGWYRPVAEFLSPVLEIFRSTAALALLPVFTLLLGIGETSKVSIVVYGCTWPVLVNTVSAVTTVDPTLLRLARSLDLSPLRLFQKVILPASVPTVFAGIRLAGAVAVLMLVAAEMVGAKAGLGFLINNSQFNFAIPQMYAGIITISAIGVGANQLLVALERRFTSWRTA